MYSLWIKSRCGKAVDIHIMEFGVNERVFCGKDRNIEQVVIKRLPDKARVILGLCEVVDGKGVLDAKVERRSEPGVVVPHLYACQTEHRKESADEIPNSVLCKCLSLRKLMFLSESERCHEQEYRCADAVNG